MTEKRNTDLLSENCGHQEEEEEGEDNQWRNHGSVDITLISVQDWRDYHTSSLCVCMVWCGVSHHDVHWSRTVNRTVARPTLLLLQGGHRLILYCTADKTRL